MKVLTQGVGYGLGKGKEGEARGRWEFKRVRIAVEEAGELRFDLEIMGSSSKSEVLRV